jgi:ABC-type Fe3+/spermidine/putrescine transport system ATPase subunit
MIVLNQVTKYFGRTKAIDNISLNIAPSSSIVIVGPSGSGKTTLLRLISGLDMPDRGEISIDGVLASKNGFILEPHKRNLGFIFQTPALWPHMTVAQNILFGMHGKPKTAVNQRLKELLHAMLLTGMEHRYPHQLSGGEARRVSIARSLAPQPKYLLMDEPLIHLDPDLKNKMLSLIKSEVDQIKACLIYVTHDIDEATKFSGHIVTVRNGRLENESVEI